MRCSYCGSQIKYTYLIQGAAFRICAKCIRNRATEYIRLLRDGRVVVEMLIGCKNYFVTAGGFIDSLFSII